MKTSLLIKKSVLCTLMVFSVFFFSCKTEDALLLEYQAALKTADFTATVDGFSCKMKLCDVGRRLVITEPECINGVSVIKEGGEVYLAVGDYRTELTGTPQKTALRIFGAFALSASPDPSDTSDVFVSEDGFKYSVIPGDGAVPEKITSLGSPAITVEDIAPEPEEGE
ncbi:MAG: hypothetical protein IJT70_01005 [Clostridia bacterium]|nr:hypothetical protein [Clostridia bacterium]